MAYTALSLQKITALVAAVLVTLGVQGSMLASFDALAAAPTAMQTQAACNAVNPKASEVIHARS